MPPKTRKQDVRGDEGGVEELETDFSVSSPRSTISASSAVLGYLLSTEQLQQVLEANTKSMMALMDRRGPAPDHRPASSGESSHALQTRVDIPKWVEGESPSDFFGKYEQALAHNGVDKSKWGSLLQVYISGSAQASFKQINPVLLKDYEQVKQEMLESLGDTPDGADKRWFTLSRQRGESHRALFRRVHNTGFRRMHGLDSKEECCNKMILSKFLTLLSPDRYGSVVGKRPKNGQEAARFAQEYEEDASFARSLQPRSSGGHYNSYYKREQNSVVANSQGSAGGTNGSKNGSGNQGSGSNNSSSPVHSQGVGTNQLNVDKLNKQDKFYKKDRKPITCYGCGEPGHIRPNCPNKVRRVKSPEHSKVMVVSGWLAGCEVDNLRVDTGADRTVVRQDFVPEDAYTGEVVRLDSWRGAQFSDHKIASIAIQVGSVEVIARVAVVEQLDCPSLLGSDLGRPMTKELMKMVVAQLDEESEEVRDSEPDRSTRAQAEKEDARDKEDELASAQAECVPIPLSEVFDFPDAYFEQDPVATPVEELSEWPEFEGADLPLPSMSVADTDSLVKEQKEDSSLKRVWQLRLKDEKGYAFEKEVLVHFTSDGVEDSVMRVVVPTGRRLQVLQVAYSSLAAGHFGFKKTFARISRHFLWPKMWGQVKEYVRTCVGCQRAARQDKARAPLQPLPCVSEPFEKVAFDLVGPLPKTNSGYRYRISSNSFRGIYSFQVLPAAATKRGRLLLSSVKGKIIEWVIVVKEIPISTRNSRLHRLGTGRPG